jgi:hypothetical protein
MELSKMCKCEGTGFIDSMCHSCLNKLIAKCQNEMNKLKDEIVDISATMDEALFYLENVE